MALPQTTKSLEQRKEIVSLQVRGLKAKLAFLQAGHEVFMPYVIAQAMNEKVAISSDQRRRISQVMNGNVQPEDLPLLELLERSTITLKKSRKAA